MLNGTDSLGAAQLCSVRLVAIISANHGEGRQLALLTHKCLDDELESNKASEGDESPGRQITIITIIFHMKASILRGQFSPGLV